MVTGHLLALVHDGSTEALLSFQNLRKTLHETDISDPPPSFQICTTELCPGQAWAGEAFAMVTGPEPRHKKSGAEPSEAYQSSVRLP